MTIKAPADIVPLWQLWQQAFGDSSEFLELFFTKGFSPCRCRCIYDGDKPVSVLYWFDCRYQGQKLAYLYAVATEQSYRRQGLCRILIEDTHRYLEAAGYDGCILVPGTPELFAYYRRLGYETIGYVRQFSCAAGRAVPLTGVSAAQYGALRQQYLPENGVIQDSAVLTLLAGYCQLYAGADFLAAVCADNGTLHIRELLGDPARASGILGALGYEAGTVRTPGTETPLAMARWFFRSPAQPLYFGIPLD